MSETQSPAGAHALVITRIFDAPRALVWKAYTEAEHLERWWGPKGTTLRVARLEVAPGGVFLYACVGPDGQELWGKFVYREVSPIERLAFVSGFADPEGNTVPAFFSADWPLEVFNVVTLEEEGGKTRLTLRGGPQNATPEQQAFFEGMLPSMDQGFKGTFDQLEAYLAELQR
jgi:uncharacterized protein YndB with AHSA1/START domain